MFYALALAVGLVIGLFISRKFQQRLTTVEDRVAIVIDAIQGQAESTDPNHIKGGGGPSTTNQE